MLNHLKSILARRSLPSLKTRISVEGKKLLYSVALFFFSIGAMDSNPSHSHCALQLKRNDPRYANLSFIDFQKAKIKANAAQLMREIPKLEKLPHDMYTPAQAAEIVRTASELFGGDNQTSPVPGFLGRLEALEKNVSSNHSLHGLSSVLYELERAIELIRSKHTILEFQHKIKLPAIEDPKVKAAIAHAPLEIDVDICAQDQNGQMILEKLKSFQFNSPTQIKGVERALDGLHKIKTRLGIDCRMHTKFTMPEEIQTYARTQGIPLASDSSQAIIFPQHKPAFHTHQPADVIGPERIKIHVPKKCIVCYEQVNPDKAEFTKDLEEAHVDYLNAGLHQKADHHDLPSWRSVFADAKKRFCRVPGFFKKIIAPCVSCMEEGQWSALRTTLFELMAAYDAPAHKEVVAFGAELFFDSESPTKFNGAPSFKLQDGVFKFQNGSNVGYDLDVLLREKDAPEKYSFIEATTGGASVKALEKFQSMGRELNAEVYILHNLNKEHTAFERTAYWKHPACIALPNNSTYHLEWPLACRTQACLNALAQNVHQKIELEVLQETLDQFMVIYNQLISTCYRSNEYHPTSYIFDDLPVAIQAIFKLIDGTDYQADEEVFKLKIRAGLEALLAQERRYNHPGSIAFAIVVLNQLNCTIQDQNLRDRYLTITNQHAFDLNALLREALMDAIHDLAAQIAAPVAELKALALV